VFECLLRVFMGLLRELMRGEVVSFAVSCSCGLVRVGGLVVKLCGSVVCALWHSIFSSLAWMLKLCQRPIQPPSTVRTVPVT
jgi:hypothetical protein